MPIAIFVCKVCHAQYHSDIEGSEEKARELATQCENNEHHIHKYDVGQQFYRLPSKVVYTLTKIVWQKQRGKNNRIPYYMVKISNRSRLIKTNDESLQKLINKGILVIK